ncbi:MULTISPECIES: glycosyltransferase family 4 protein [unclassified Collinsella]|uniref:glycosyltransferase family 4 protein n=1 Tax=unclassified Collinsella TaxID=2637548 RepID=UPI0013143988|nr:MULTISPECIES: glycosyltransferase family 4 protein [unclassified Collinsella]
MNISFFSNYLNAHQLPLALAFDSMSDVNYTCVSLVAGGGNVGRKNLDNDYPFVVKAYEGESDAAEAMRHAVEDDIVVFQHMGGHEEYVKARAKTGKPFFRATERLLKRGAWWRWAPPKIYRTWDWYTRYKRSRMYVLCISGFAAGDLARFGFPVERCLKWGYFPQVDTTPMIARGPLLQGGVALGSAQRLIPLKRVDLQVRMAARLKEAGVPFRLEIAGGGPEREALEGLAKELNVEDEVAFLGTLSKNDTADLMRRSDVFLATSNRKEGWGATVNEAMSMGCAVVASSQIGSVPFLIADGLDGAVFRSEDIDSLTEVVMGVVRDRLRIESMGSAAQEKVHGLWGAQIAAERFIAFSEKFIIDGSATPFDDGPLGSVEALDEDWFQCGEHK